MMKAAELRKKSAQDLQKLLLDLRREHFNLRMQRGSGQTIKTSRLREIKREVARIKTIMNTPQG